MESKSLVLPLLLIGLILLFGSAINPKHQVFAEQTDEIKLFWESLSSENYRLAFDTSFRLGQKNPVYYEMAFYLQMIYYTSEHLFHQIGEEIRNSDINDENIKRFQKEGRQFLAKESPFIDLTNAIIEYNERQNRAKANQLVKQAQAKKKTVLGYYLNYTFQGDTKALRNAISLTDGNAFMRKTVLIHDYNNGVDKSKILSGLEVLLSNDSYYFDKEDYLNFIQMGFGERFVSGVGPSGPNGEPFFGVLCTVREWEAFKKFSPRHQVLFAFAVGGPGGQNTDDAEKLLELIEEQTLTTYAPIIRMLRIYEGFHAYQYADVYQGADELIKMDLTNPFYFVYVYDLAYEYEMFFFNGYCAEQTMIDKATAIYEKAYQLAPKWSASWRGSVLQGKGRSQFYAKRYQDSITTLKKALNLKDDPICYIFLSLDYYAVGDKTNGRFWENKVRSIFANNKNVLNDFERLLKGLFE